MARSSAAAAHGPDGSCLSEILERRGGCRADRSAGLGSVESLWGSVDGLGSVKSFGGSAGVVGVAVAIGCRLVLIGVAGQISQLA